MRGQRLSREEERVERRSSVAESEGRREKDSGVGRAEETAEERSVGVSERRWLRVVTMWVGGEGAGEEGMVSE